MSFSASGHRACPRSSSVDSDNHRPKQIILVTTLLDPKRYPKANSLSLSSALASDGSQFQALKTTLNMEMIWAKSPQMVTGNRMHLLAYNLLREMWTSAELAQVPPMRISCKALGNC